MERKLPDPVARFVWIDSEMMSGAPCFRGTRVPVRTLFDYLRKGYPLDVFLDHFEGVTREQALGVLDLSAQGFLTPLDGARAA
jgi:uncharacterized protein (DUF433 family)